MDLKTATLAVAKKLISLGFGPVLAEKKAILHFNGCLPSSLSGEYTYEYCEKIANRICAYEMAEFGKIREDITIKPAQVLGLKF